MFKQTKIMSYKPDRLRITRSQLKFSFAELEALCTVIGARATDFDSEEGEEFFTKAYEKLLELKERSAPSKFPDQL